MAVSRFLCRPRLFSPVPASVRLASGSAKQKGIAQGGTDRDGAQQGGKRQGGGGPPGRNSPPKTMKPMIPADVRLFIRPDGAFVTTPENAQFLEKYDLEWSTGKATKVQTSGRLRFLLGPSLQMAWSPRHIIHPYHLKFLSPRGDPLAPSFRARYEEKTLKQPLWVYVTTSNGASAVVRTTLRSRLKKAILTALEGMGYTGAGVGEKREIHGTLWINDNNSVRSANLPLAELGQLIAESLDKNYSRKTTV